ncbi:MAG: hypothetical protein GC200_09565 [Tepidisphaera sp.]|nr:hypothetical protein [Tepidisphaera sp.]
MKSIRRELTLRVVTRVLPLIVLGCVLSYFLVRAVVYREFDTALRHEMQVLASAAERIGDGVDFDFAVERVQGTAIDSGLDYFFDARLSDGSLLKQSPLLKGARLDMPKGRPGQITVAPIMLPNGRQGRGCEYTFEPRVVTLTEHPGPVDRPNAPTGPVSIVIGASTSDLDRPLAALALTEVLVGAGLLGATLLALLSSVRAGLVPLSSLAHEVTDIQPANLAARVSEHGQPQELVPIASRLNALLARLEAAFAREKQFASNAAHELRTPVAEVRTMAEVAADAPAHDMRTTLLEIASVAAEMQGTIDTLLTIARANSGQLAIAISEVDLGTYLRELCARRIAARPGAAPLTCEAPDDLLVETDLAAIASILGNLIDNALAYTPSQGRILARAIATPTGVEVCVRNHVADFTHDDLEAMFEPFWRKRGTFIAGSHSGLGLALVRALCEVIGAQIRAELLPATSELAVFITLPRRPGLPAEDAPAREPSSASLPPTRPSAPAALDSASAPPSRPTPLRT